MNDTGTFRSQLPGMAAALAFFLAGLPALRHFGVTWDEPESFAAASGSLRVVRDFFAGNPVEYPWRELPGYHFVIDAARGLFALGTAGLLAEPTAHHLFNLCLSSLSVFLIFNLALALSGSRRAAIGAALCLALFPRFIAHSQNNPKDLPALFAFLTVAVITVHACRLGGGRRAMLAGAALGLAFTTHILTAVLPGILLLWMFCRRRPWFKERRRELLIIGATSLLAAFCTWPWLWPDPLGRLFWAAGHVTSFSYRTKVLYLGNLYSGTEMPWHYFTVSFAATTPLLLLLLAAAGLIRFATTLKNREDLPGLELGAFGLAWCLPLVLLEMTAASHYDGTRHLLMLIPGFCLLAAAGLDWLAATASRRLEAAGMPPARRGCVAAAPAALLAIHLLSINLYMHPYQDAYLNEAVNLLLDRPAEAVFEVEYWGNAFRAGAEWLNANAEPDAVVILPVSLLANYYLHKPGVAPEEVNFFDLDPPPKYIMFITRRAIYGEAIRLVEEHFEEVFTIRRQHGTLLKIYRNRLKTPHG